MDKEDLEGMLCSVYKNSNLGDCANNGVTSKATQVLLVGENVPKIHKAKDTPVLKLVQDKCMSKDRIYAAPLEEPSGLIGPMFGGNFIYSEDSRFPHEFPIPVYDCFNTPEEYYALTTD